jgi:hypothetical protein
VSAPGRLERRHFRREIGGVSGLFGSTIEVGAMDAVVDPGTDDDDAAARGGW